MSKVIDKNVFKDESIKFLKNLSEKPKSSLVEIKRLTKIDDKITSDLADEREAFYRLLDSENKKIGIKSFLNKTKPNWK